MPVFVEWEWKEQTKSFLVIFHFYDDFSKPNLRVKKYEKGFLLVLTPESQTLEPKEAWMSWAPSHPEVALLSQLLSYANIVNGLKEPMKRELKLKLEGWEIGAFIEEAGVYRPDVWVPHVPKILTDNLHIIYFEKSKGSTCHHHCMQLCPEYIDYLQELLKPYLK